MGRKLCLLWRWEGARSRSSGRSKRMCCGSLKAQTQRAAVSCPAYGLDSPGGITPVQPTCSSAEPSKAQSPCWLHFLLYTRKHQAAQKTSSSLYSSQCLNSSRHSCMFHTHSVITFVLLKGKEKVVQPLLAFAALQLSSTQGTVSMNVIYFKSVL